jgi:hypothetical protein
MGIGAAGTVRTGQTAREQNAQKPERATTMERAATAERASAGASAATSAGASATISAGASRPQRQRKRTWKAAAMEETTQDISETDAIAMTRLLELDILKQLSMLSFS